MKRIVLFIALISLFAVGSAMAATAIGVRAGYASDHDSAFFVGGHVKGVELTPDIDLVPNVEVAFFNGAKLYAFNGDALYELSTTDLAGYTPYLGGELGINMWSGDGDSNTKLVINLLAGMEKALDERKALMFELKLGLSDYSPDIKLTAGLTFF
ncbi:hypothetical protein H8E07_12320 [bacterium]|nr:hypothetical protein [bacterium]